MITTLIMLTKKVLTMRVIFYIFTGIIIALIFLSTFIFSITPCFDAKISKMITQFPANIDRMEVIVTQMSELNSKTNLEGIIFYRNKKIKLRVKGNQILDYEDREVEKAFSIQSLLLNINQLSKSLLNLIGVNSTQLSGDQYLIGSIGFDADKKKIYFTLDSGGVLGPSYGYLKSFQKNILPESNHSFQAIPVPGYPDWYVFHHPKIIERNLNPSLLCRALSFLSECVGKKINS